MTDEPVKKPSLKYLEPNYDRVKRSKKHENRLGKRLGGKRLPRSGGARWSKWDKSTADGDISAPNFHFEHKRTENKSMPVQLEWLEKVSQGARKTGKDPGLLVTFERKGQEPYDWVMIPLECLERLMKAGSDEPDAGG